MARSVPWIRWPASYRRRMHLGLVSLLVDDYDEAIRFFVDAVGFELVEDAPATTSVGGRPKRWVVVRPPGASTGVLLAGRRRAPGGGGR